MSDTRETLRPARRAAGEGEAMTALKAWRVTVPPLGWDSIPGEDGIDLDNLGRPAREATVVTEYALTRSKARFRVAAQLEDAGWVDRIGDALRAIRSVRRAPELDEPVRTIDPTMTLEQRQLLEHAIGGWRGRPGTEPHRNYYVDRADCPLTVACLERHWVRIGRRFPGSTDVMTHVTPEGFRALGLPVPVPEGL